MKLYQFLAQQIGRLRGLQARATELTPDQCTMMTDLHADLSDFVRTYFPSGSGIDRGTRIDLDRSTGECLIFQVDFHHMNEGGMYDGWSEFIMRVKPSLQFDMTISFSGRDRNQIKEYLHDTYHYVFDQEKTQVQWYNLLTKP